MSDAVSTLAIVLKRVNHGEADRVLTLITSDHGRISGFAKGVRRQKSKLSGGLELCMLSEVSYIPSRRPEGLVTMTSARMKEYYDEVVKDYDTLQHAFTLLRVIDKASEYEDNTDRLFTLSLELLRGLNDPQRVHATTLWFLVTLSSMLGQGAQLSSPTNADAFVNGQTYSFDYDKMAFVEDEQGTLRSSDVKLLKLMLVADSPKKLQNVVSIEESLSRLGPIAQILEQQLTHL